MDIPDDNRMKTETCTEVSNNIINEEIKSLSLYITKVVLHREGWKRNDAWTHVSVFVSFVKGTCVKSKRTGNPCSMKTILQIKHTFRIG